MSTPIQTLVQQVIKEETDKKEDNKISEKEQELIQAVEKEKKNRLFAQNRIDLLHNRITELEKQLDQLKKQRNESIKMAQQNSAEKKYLQWQRAQTDAKERLRITPKILHSWIEWIKDIHRQKNTAVLNAEKWLKETIEYICDVRELLDKFRNRPKTYGIKYLHRDGQWYEVKFKWHFDPKENSSPQTKGRKRQGPPPKPDDPRRLHWLCTHYPDMIRWQRWACCEVSSRMKKTAK